MARNRWTREELILALNLYLKLPFGKLHQRTPEIIRLAGLLGRSPSSIAMRLNNYASVDEFHQKRGIGGLPGGKAQVEPIWNEYLADREKVLFESEVILASLEKSELESKYPELPSMYDDLQGETKVREIKTRVNQEVFRQMVLANYSNQCAITGINIPSLLIASHIIPWSENQKERLNPENGICLSPLYDSAFDKGLIGVTPELRVVLSESLRCHQKKEFYLQHFGILDGIRLRNAEKYKPRREFLEWHLSNIFCRQ
jgi:putative restriction endonuclease